MKANKKYICTGGFIITNDGNRHYIEARQVPALYNIDPTDCVIVTRDADLFGYRKASLKILRPRSDGNYCLK